MEKEKVPWGVIGPPGSKKRSDYLASIRKKNRNSKKKIEAKATAVAEEHIGIIESKTIDLDLDEVVTTPEPEKKKAVKEVVVREKKRMETPGDPGVPYVSYPY